jgi:hypothetical protein
VVGGVVTAFAMSSRGDSNGPDTPLGNQGVFP